MKITRGGKTLSISQLFIQVTTITSSNIPIRVQFYFDPSMTTIITVTIIISYYYHQHCSWVLGISCNLHTNIFLHTSWLFQLSDLIYARASSGGTTVNKYLMGRQLFFFYYATLHVVKIEHTRRAHTLTTRGTVDKTSTTTTTLMKKRMSELPPCDDDKTQRKRNSELRSLGHMENRLQQQHGTKTRHNLSGQETTTRHGLQLQTDSIS